MIFSDYKTPQEALEAFQLQGHSAIFVQPLAHTVSPGLRERLELVRDYGYTNSEFAIAEGLIFPVLLEVWSYYLEELKPWRNPSFGTAKLKGNPDYVITRIAKRGPLRFQPPYGVIVEAKKENFDEGWGQCLAALVVARELNGHPELPVWGAVTTGRSWQFGRLEASAFTLDTRDFGLVDLSTLCGALRYVFEQVRHYPLPLLETNQGAF